MRCLMAVVIGAGFGLGAPGASAVDIVSGDASMSILEGFQAGQFVPFSLPHGDGALRLDGPASTDVLYKYGWYFKTPIGSHIRLMGSLLAPSTSVSGDTVTFTWLSNGDGPVGAGGRFDATLTVRLTDGELVDQARVTSQLRVRNPDPIPTTIRIYHLLDLDLPGGEPNTAPDDTLALVSTTPLQARYSEASLPNYALIDGAGSFAHRIDQGLALRNLLVGTTTDLAVASGPYTGDGAMALQWTLALAPGEERTIATSFGINMPATPAVCRADFNGVGGVTVQDVFDFLVAYFANQPSADINGAGGVTVQDVFDYLVLYFGGC